MPVLFPIRRNKLFRVVVFLLVTTALILMIRDRWHGHDLSRYVATVEWHTSWVLVVLLLYPMNWGLEVAKFRTLLGPQENLGLLRIIRAVFGGVAMSLLLPNRAGEQAGRILLLPPRIRAVGAAASLTGSVLQNLWIMVCGVWSLPVLLQHLDIAPSVTGLLWLTPLAILALWAVIQIPVVGRFLHQVFQHIRKSFASGRVTKAAFLALCRYVTFSLQFWFCLLAVGADPGDGSLWALISGLFFCQTVLPLPPALNWIGRLELAMLIGGVLALEPGQAVMASLLLWLVNLVPTGVIGAMLLNQTKRNNQPQDVPFSVSSLTDR